jgi:hypothetical protein
MTGTLLQGGKLVARWSVMFLAKRFLLRLLADLEEGCIVDRQVMMLMLICISVIGFVVASFVRMLIDAFRLSTF